MQHATEMVGFVYDNNFDMTRSIPSYVPFRRLGLLGGVLFRLTDKTLKLKQQEGRYEDIITSAEKKQSLDIIEWHLVLFMMLNQC
jgi:hypothetical protein